MDYRSRVRKLHHINNELELEKNNEGAKNLKNKVLELEKKVEKTHDELRGRIARRSEL